MFVLEDIELFTIYNKYKSNQGDSCGAFWYMRNLLCYLYQLKSVCTYKYYSGSNPKCGSLIVRFFKIIYV